MTEIRYRPSQEAWDGFAAFVQEQIAARGARRILEIGGGANPALPIEFVRALRLDYTILDLDAGELAKAPAGYHTFVGDILHVQPSELGGFDLVFSKMLAEHMTDGRRFHANIFSLLAPGGAAIHFFPTLFAPPFLVNRLLPEAWATTLLHKLQPGRESSGRHRKFPAYYSWCYGPSAAQLRRLESLGYHVEQYTGFFGHGIYYRRIPGAQQLHQAFCRWLLRHPIPQLTSFSYAVLVKPNMQPIAERSAAPAVHVGA